MPGMLKFARGPMNASVACVAWAERSVVSIPTAFTLKEMAWLVAVAVEFALAVTAAAPIVKFPPR